MKTKRQAKILEIIGSKDIETQDQLLVELKAAGFSGTQATVSRDIKELHIVKELTALGTYHYAASSKKISGSFSARLNTIFKECVISYDHAQNIIVVKTLPGLANAACSALDSMGMSAIVGTLAGDDTALIVMRDNECARSFCGEMKRILQQ